MDCDKKKLNLNYYRRFGVEIELNSFDLKSRPVGYEVGKLPEGIHYIGNIVQKITQEKVVIHKWRNDHYNDFWIVKPDGSCGMEVCTPVLKGWTGLLSLCRVIDSFKKDYKILADQRCSFHVHIDVSDLTDVQIANVLSWWIKCEPVFMDSVPECRKKNQYCQFIGMTDMFSDVEEGLIPPDQLIKKLGICKYYTVNTYHYYNKRRKTIEFRIMDNKCCLFPWMAKNWVRLILHFVETIAFKGTPLPYERGNKWSSYCWLDPFDVFEILGFMPDQCDLSPGLEQVRSWFVSRLDVNTKNNNFSGIMSSLGRRISREQIDRLCEYFPYEFNISDDDIYSDKFRI